MVFMIIFLTCGMISVLLAYACPVTTHLALLCSGLGIMWIAWYFIGKYVKRTAFFLGGIFCGMVTVEMSFVFAVTYKLFYSENTYPAAVLLAGAVLFGMFFCWLRRGGNTKDFAIGNCVVLYCAALPTLLAAGIFCIACHSDLSPRNLNNIGVFYDEWLPIPSEKFRWYSKAVESGCYDAYYSLGRCYEEGHGISQDYAKAAHWYHKAGEFSAKKYAYRALFRLAYFYRNGLGVPRDRQKARELEYQIL
ncbi:MAG: sel1 repeat family protein [Lentisphaeria bacterium]|nr:sel1 repeat family protein [Lentisphaeria bacterium]